MSTAHAAHEKKVNHKAPDGFVRAGNQLICTAHVEHVALPVEGDPKQPLTLRFASGATLQLEGDDADAVVKGLGC